MLVTRGLERVLGDLTEIGYDTRWTVMGAADVGAPHQRDRIWIRSVLANTNLSQCKRERESIGVLEGFPRVGDGGAMVPNATSKRQQGQGQYEQSLYKKTNCYGQTDNVKPIGRSNIWATEPNVGRVVNGVAARMDRLTAIGNGQVPEVARRAWEALNDT
jgi:DNA (cytosine-5)-methyltransferase 1